MSDPQSPSDLCCCIVHKKKSDDLSTIAEAEDSMELTSLLEKLNPNLEQSDVMCPLCGGSIKAKPITSQNCENPIDNTEESTSEETPQVPSTIWNTIIVNQIPVRIKHVRIDRNKFISLFAQYGTIEDAYLCDSDPYPPKHEKVATIKYKNEEDARKVLEASRQKLIKYEDYVLMTTLVSEDYCPIQSLLDNCLERIFLELSAVRDKFSVESVCKRWKAIGSGCWSSVNKVENCYLSSTWETIISRTTASIREVKMSINDEDDDDDREPEDSMKRLTLIAENLTQLETFALTVYAMDSLLVNPQLQSIVSKNRGLKCLGLWWVALEEGFMDLLPGGIEEIQINFTRRGKGRQRAIQAAPLELSRFTNLQTLALFNCSISKNQLSGIECLENLRVLKLTQSRVNPTNIQKIANFTKLEYLTIPNCQIGDATLSKILKNNKGLTHLDISGIKKITNFSFQHVFQLPDLQVLLMKNLDKVDDKYFTALPKLETLNCNGSTLITDKGIQRLFTPDSMLQRLYIADCSITLETLKIASEWAAHKEKAVRMVYLDAKMAEAWINSGFQEPLSIAELAQTNVLIGPYQESPFWDPLEEDWQEVFNDFL